jgi:hypothetical protein
VSEGGKTRGRGFGWVGDVTGACQQGAGGRHPRARPARASLHPPLAPHQAAPTHPATPFQTPPQTLNTPGFWWSHILWLTGTEYSMLDCDNAKDLKGQLFYR